MGLKLEVDADWCAYAGALIRLYIRNVQARVFVAFDEIWTEAEEAVEEYYQHYPASDWADMGDAHDAAIDHTFLYILIWILSDLKLMVL